MLRVRGKRALERDAHRASLSNARFPRTLSDTGARGHEPAGAIRAQGVDHR